jgi:hypothetical protein
MKFGSPFVAAFAVVPLAAACVLLFCFHPPPALIPFSGSTMELCKELGRIEYDVPAEKRGDEYEVFAARCALGRTGAAERVWAAHGLLRAAEAHLAVKAYRRSIAVSQRLQKLYPEAWILDPSRLFRGSVYGDDPDIYLDVYPHTAADAVQLVGAGALLGMGQRAEAQQALLALVVKRRNSPLDETDRTEFKRVLPRPHRVALRRLLLLRAKGEKPIGVVKLLDHHYVPGYFPDDDAFLLELAEVLIAQRKPLLAVKVLYIARGQLDRRIRAVREGKDDYEGDRSKYHTWIMRPRMITDPVTGVWSMIPGEEETDPKKRAEMIKAQKLKELGPRLKKVEEAYKLVFKKFGREGDPDVEMLPRPTLDDF